jgi:hypothetical protein
VHARRKIAMNSCRCLFAALAVVAALAGCAGPQVRAHIDSVNAEYRQLEDYVYCLEDENAKLQRQLDHERGIRSIPGRPAARPSGTETSPSADDLGPPTIEPGTPTTPPASGARSSVQRPKTSAASAGTNEKLNLGPPLIEMPDAAEEPTPATDDLPTPATPREIHPAAPEAIPPAPADTKVTHIFLNPLLTGGADFDRQPGDEGLSIVLEPRNAADEYVPQAGAVSVVVLDPAKEGDAARIARWDFTLTATQQKLKTTSAAKGIRLEMPWPASPPTANQLKLFVRYETADGRRLQADRDIYITPPGQIAQRWTPRPADRPRTTAAPAAASPPLPLGEGRGEGDRIVHEPAPAATPPIISKIEPTAPPPQLLSPPPATADAKAKPAPPVWSPNR